MGKNELDEMQLQKRNKIGNQCFMLLSYLLLADIGAYGFGFRWLKYPTDVFIILLVCLSYYLIRLIWNHAYIGPESKNKSSLKKIIFVAALTGLVSAATAFIAQKKLVKIPEESAGDNGALILFIISTVAIIITILVTVITKIRDKE